MIIYPNQGAGLCNRLLAAAHLIAHAESSGNVVWHAALRRYAKIFEGIPQNGIIVHYPSVRRPKYFFRTPVTILRSGRFPPGEILFTDPIVQRAEESALLLLIGWRFRDDVALCRHGDMIRKIFRPNATYRAKVDHSIGALRQRCDQIVGVHIRRGDYQSFREGRYYYGDEVYRRVMSEICGQMQGRTGFLIVSDSLISDTAFADFTYQAGPGREIDDLYALAACDYIVGPPSTYSGWAALYGKKPLLHLDQANTPALLKLFSLVNAVKGEFLVN